MRGHWCRALVLCLLPAAALAQAQPAADPKAPPVGLDALLKLPSKPATPSAQPRIGGATRPQWQTRFARARLDLLEARVRLTEAQEELGEVASDKSSWQVAAPGGTSGGDTGPLSYSLRQEIRRGREDVATAEKALDELRIQANLAGVPPEWTEEEPVANSEPGGFSREAERR